MSKIPLIEQVYDGMKVVDAAGDDIGKVDEVRFPDANESTRGTGGGWVGIFSMQSRTPDTIQARYRKTGYFHVDGKGWIDTDRFVLATEIASVENKVVTLNVAKEQLAEG